MAFKNEIYTCGNATCKPYLFNSKALLDVIVDGKPFSINSELPYFQYESEETYLETVLSGENRTFLKRREARCPHCQGICQVDTIEVNPQLEREHIFDQLNALDDQIAVLMEKFKGQ